MTELLVGTKKGLFVLEGDAGRAVRGHVARIRRRAGRVRDARRAHRPVLRLRDLRVLRAEDLYTDDLGGRVGAGRRRRAPEDAEKPLERLWTIVPAEDDGHSMRAAHRACSSRAATRRDLGAQPGVLGAADATGVETWSRRHVHALDRDLAGRSVPRRTRHLGGRRLAHRRRRPDVASRKQGHVSALHAGGGARGDDHAVRAQHAPSADAARAALHAVPRRRLPLRRCRRELDDDRRRPPVGLRLPDGDGPGRSDSAYVIPLVADMDRTTPDGRVRVYETRDAGASWIERGDGLPSEDAYLTILRQAFCREGSGRRWGSTSVRRRATSSDPAMRARRGSPRRRSCRRCTRCAPHRPSAECTAAAKRPRFRIFAIGIRD